MNGSTRSQQHLLIRTSAPVRCSFTVVNTRSAKSLSLNINDRSLTDISRITDELCFEHQKRGEMSTTLIDCEMSTKKRDK